METCVFSFGCNQPVYGAGRCNRHYQRFHKYGHDEPDPLQMPERFWRFVVKGDGCWEWIGAKVRGYGYFRLGGKQRKAHRVAYELLVGPIPDGLTIDHLCQNKGCVNPEHMEPVSVSENLSRLGRRMSACRRGHPFTPENTYVQKRGSRVCRTCIRAAQRRWWQQRPDRGQS